MTSTEEGYEDERFESDVPHNFHCAICLNVLKQPMQCVRNEHSFCKPCIVRHLQVQQRCPNCMEALTLKTLRPSRVLMDLISQLKIRCNYVGRGCTDIIKLEMLEGHDAACGFCPAQCSNDGCGLIVNRKDLSYHEMNNCSFRKEKCEICGKNVPPGEQKLHCYVTRKEMDGVRKEISSVKEIVLNLSRELTRHMGDVNDQFEHINQRVINLQTRMNGINYEMEEFKKGKHDTKVPRSSISSLGTPEGSPHKNRVWFPNDVSVRFRGASITSSEMNVSIRNDVIVAGGLGLQSVEMFSWTTRRWIHLPPMTSKRHFSSSFVYQGQMFICGGRKSEESAEVLNLKECQQWKKFPAKLPQWTWGHASVVYDNYLIIFGGKKSGKVVKNIYKICLDGSYPSLVVCRMPEPRSFHSAQCFGDKVIIVGGTTTDYPSSCLDTMLLYDITNNCCQTLAPLPFAVCNMATVAWNDDIVLIGGKDKKNKVLNTVVSYNIKEGKYRLLPPMKHERASCTAVITDNTIIVMGGSNKAEVTANLNSVECFDLNNFVWEELPPMKERRDGPTAVVKCDF